MGGRQADGNLSQSKRSIQRRKLYAKNKLSVEPASLIGVFGAKSSRAEGPSLAQDYHCNDCKSPVPLGSKVCPICERELIWPEGMKVAG